MKIYSDPSYQRTTAASRRAMRRVRYIHRAGDQPYVTGATRRKERVWAAKQATKKARRTAKQS
jgi:hypothetical protein